MADWQIRDAAPDELAAAFAIFREYEFHGGPAPSAPDVPDFFPHVARTGRILVAAAGSRIVGYAGAITRGEVTHLTDLFVRPEVQSGSIGRALLTAILPNNGVRCTCSTADPRALSLYIRAGMRPWWPQFALYGAELPADALVDGTVEIEVARVDHPALLDWEWELGGRPRPEDFAYWAAHDATALWFRRDGAILGYAIVRTQGGTVRHPADATIGPLGVRRAEDAAACTMAALGWVRTQAANLCLMLPGPHPALAPLLRAGFRIEDVYSFAVSGDVPFCDPRRYISSGPDLL
jgi:GNAT superfamily N-acetyltransferase